MTLSDWTPEYIAAAAALLASGLTFTATTAALNARFGTAFTRNAVIGKLHRSKLMPPRAGLSSATLHRDRAAGRGLSPVRRTAFAPPLPRQARARVVLPRAAALIVAAPPAEAISLEVLAATPLLDLRRHQCRWPLRRDDEGDWLFCPQGQHHGSYCAAHALRARGPQSKPRLRPDRAIREPLTCV